MKPTNSFKISDSRWSLVATSLGIEKISLYTFADGLANDWFVQFAPPRLRFTPISQTDQYKAWFRWWFLKQAETMGKLATDPDVQALCFTPDTHLAFRCLMQTLLDPKQALVQRMVKDFISIQPKFFNKKTAWNLQAPINT
jgi:hypothetical protein